MNELIIELTDINAQDFFGLENETVSLLKKYYPKLKIVARGNKLKAYGDEEELEAFDSHFEQLTSHFAKYNKLDENSIERILSGDHQNGKAFGAASEIDQLILVHGINGRKIKAQTFNQKRLVEAVLKNDMVFAIGPAGTGKTYTGVAMAVKALKEKQVRRIILTRPAVEAGENLGFLPGDLKEKLDPYMQPLYDALRDMIDSEKLQSYIETGVIQIAPLAFMRGRTLDDAFVILDEAQNTTHAQMKMFLTRLGFNSKMVITGDITQIDLPSGVTSGLRIVRDILEGVNDLEFMDLTQEDVVRHKLVGDIVAAYGRYDEANQVRQIKRGVDR